MVLLHLHGLPAQAMLALVRLGQVGSRDITSARDLADARLLQSGWREGCLRDLLTGEGQGLRVFQHDSFGASGPLLSGLTMGML